MPRDRPFRIVGGQLCAERREILTVLERERDDVTPSVAYEIGPEGIQTSVDLVLEGENRVGRIVVDTIRV